MGLLLHLSDLHLADADTSGEITGDYKVEAIPLENRQRRTETIRSTLCQLGQALVESKQYLDAIVISGDIAVQGQPRGFELLPSVLSELGEVLPSEEQILIVPGNHDVSWRTSSSSRERYENFCKLRENHAYRTAWLEGIDIDSDLSLTDHAAEPPIVRATDGSFVVVGINSSNHCGVESSPEAWLAEHLDHLEQIVKGGGKDAKPVETLLDAWRTRGLFDIARVDAGQRQRIHQLLNEERRRFADVGNPPAVIAALHHQLLPVGDYEEFKPFEGITNLGEFREWLASNEVDIVLHGHKHEERILEDAFSPYDPSHARSVHRMLIVSSPTIGLGASVSGPVCRLLEFSPDMPRAADVSLRLVPATKRGINITASSLPEVRKRIGDIDAAGSGVIEAESVDEVYNALFASREVLQSLPSPLVCRIRNGPTARTVPRNYPVLAASSASADSEDEAKQQWFDDTVAWWQSETRGTSATFNHGERLRGIGFNGESQFHRLIDSLLRDEHTSRAVALLVNPEVDFASTTKAFPAFTLLQMTISNGKLNLTGYFRKQEMPHWWPINVAELALLQLQASQELATRNRSVEPGSITTVTSIPVSGRAAPKVVVPKLDMMVDNNPGYFFKALAPLFFHTSVSPGDVAHTWASLIDDWRPGDTMAADGDPVPVAGTQYLADIAASVHSANLPTEDHQRDARRRIAEILEAIAQANRDYAATQNVSDGDRQADHETWRGRIDTQIERLFETIETLCPPDEVQ